ncbi:acetate--CoA ligase family protein [Blastococcus sp. SYSU D00669]
MGTGQEADALGAVALVGASESMPWTYWLVRNLADHGFTGAVWPVNPRQSQVHGLPAFASIADLPAAPDVGVCLLRPELAEDAVEQLLGRGVRTIVLISNGFRETGDPAAAEREQRIAARCRAAGARLIGPNCVGFADLGRRLALVAEPLPRGLTAGTVSVVSQSGALLSGVVGAVAASGSGVHLAYSIGNGAAFGVADALEEFVAGDDSLLVLVLEGVGEPERFAAAARQARAAGKLVLALCLARSERAAVVAQSHTGAVVGSDRLIQAWLWRLGVVSVDSIEELPYLVQLLAHAGGRPEAGVFVLTGSGGAAGYAADLAGRYGVALAELSPTTVEALRELMPSGVYIGNPLDLTGANGERKKQVRDQVFRDPAVGVVVEPYALPWPDDAADRFWFRDGLLGLAESAREAGKVTLTASTFGEPVTPWVDELSAKQPVVSGPSFVAAMSAAAKVYPVAGGVGGGHREGAGPATARGVLAEAEARDVLARLGVPLVDGVVVDDPRAAAEHAAGVEGPFAVKAAVEGLAHKGRVSGVRLDLVSPEAVAAACEQMRRDIGAAGVDRPVRFLVQRMVRGPELLLGFIRDAVAGPTVTVGVGGWAVELVPPLGTLALTGPEAPTVDETVDSLTRWGLARAVGPAALQSFARLTAELAGHFADGDLAAYSTLELNPVVLTPEGPRVVDALLIT